MWNVDLTCAEVNHYDVRCRRASVPIACVHELTSLIQPDYLGPLDAAMFQDPQLVETFRVLPVHLRIIGTEQTSERPARPRLLFAGEVRDGQTMVGRVEMTLDGHLRWGWVRLRFTFVPRCLLQFAHPTFQICGEAGQALWRYAAFLVFSIRMSRR